MNLQEIYDRLGLTEDCLIRMSDKAWKDKVSLPSRIIHLLKKNKLLSTLDAFFCFDNKPLILFFQNPQNKEALHKAIWNFNESPIAIIVENDAVEIFNGFSIDENTKFLKSLGGKEKLDDFSYFELVTGKTWEKYEKEVKYENRVDFHLLKNIDDARTKLIKENGLDSRTVNALLGKIIFFRYLIDRHVRLNYDGKDYWTNDDLCKSLEKKDDFLSLIKHIEDKDKGFNGDMFHIHPEQIGAIHQSALDILRCLLKSEEIATGQLSLFDLYDFSILPIEFISNVYERFIGKENQEEESAYYTPTFLVDYIVSETVGMYLKKSKDNYNCRVLDPACGSGIFLVESLRRIIEKYISVNNVTNTNTENFREALRSIAKNNIFGIDKDESAIQVAIFSVYLTLLDYQNPADIENFKFPNLLGTNFICSDTFDTDNKELKALEDKKYHFDCIIGNPPWKRGGIKKDSYCEKYLKRKGILDKVGNRELAQAFVFRSLDFTYSDTQCALILVSKIFYNIKSKKFRSFILDNLFINQVFELASVRKEVFNKSNDSAIAPACVLFYKNAKKENTNKNIIEHIALKPSRFFSLFKVFSLTKNDIQKIQQDRLKKYDWLWKVLVYGSYLDFIFIKRLKGYTTINEVISTNNFIQKQGIKEKDQNRIIDTSSLVGLNYIKTLNVKKYHINNSNDKWNLSKVGYIYRDKAKNIVIDLYRAPILLITGGTCIDLHAVSAISYSDGIFKSSLTGIKGLGNSAVSILRNIQGVLNSSFFAYYNLLTFSSSGIEREETHDTEKLDVPYCEGIDDVVETIENLNNELCNSIIVDNTIKKEIEFQSDRIEKAICNRLKCSEVELDLINYALNISIPLATKSKGYERIFYPIKESDSLLKEYAQVYVNRFAKSFNKNGKHFIVEIQYSSQIIGMFFKVIDENLFNNNEIVSVQQKEDNFFVTKLSVERITESLFVQKDVRGFDKECFYIFKPNEKRLWYKAIAYLDVNEFDDAMLRVGGEKR